MILKPIQKITDIKTLEILDLASNLLDGLPDSLANLQSLRVRVRHLI